MTGAAARGPPRPSYGCMNRYLLRRIFVSIPTIIGITILIFLVMRVLPGDPPLQRRDASGGSLYPLAGVLLLRHPLGPRRTHGRYQQRSTRQ